MDIKSIQITNLTPREIRTQQRARSFPFRAVSREDPMAESRIESVFSTDREFEILELRRENGFYVFWSRGMDDAVAEEDLAVCVCVHLGVAGLHAFHETAVAD